MQNEAVGDVHSPRSVEYSSAMSSTDGFCVTNRGDQFNPFPANVAVLNPLKTQENLWFFGVFRGNKMGTLAGNGLNTVFHILESLKAFEDYAKEKSGKRTYTKPNDNSRKKRPRCFHDKIGDEPNRLDRIPLGESYRINHIFLIIDSLISTLSKRIATYSGLIEKFGYFLKLGLAEIYDDDLYSRLFQVPVFQVESYSEDFESKLEKESARFNAFNASTKGRSSFP